MKPKIKWTTELIRTEALKYKTKADFKKGSPNAYNVAVKRKLLNDEITCQHMISKLIFWDVASIKDQALKYKTRSDFKKGNPSAYVTARTRMILDEVCSHMEYKYFYWNIDSIRSEALRFKTRKEFAKGSPKAYDAAHSRGMLGDGITCAHMEYDLYKYSETKLMIEALRFNTRGDFAKGNPNAYAVAVHRNILDRICEHMKPQCIYWDVDSIRAEALCFKTRVDFQNFSSKAYSAARKRNMIDDGITCSHMEAQRSYWDLESIRAEAFRFKTRNDFKKGSSKAYEAAVNKGILNDGITCSHMDRGKYGFNPNKSGILYYIKFESEKELPLYKIGITNLNTIERLQSMYIGKDITATIIKEIWFDDGMEAWNLEKQLHKEFKDYRYQGDFILKNGNTELFITDVLNYDTGQQSA